jgi:hypothetical protein
MEIRSPWRHDKRQSIKGLGYFDARDRGGCWQSAADPMRADATGVSEAVMALTFTGRLQDENRHPILQTRQAIRSQRLVGVLQP